VASTLSRKPYSLSPVGVKQFAREGDELLEPQRLVAKLGTELPDLVRLRIVQIVVARDDSDRSPGQARNRPDGPQELKAARQRHPEIQDDRIGPMRLGQAQPFIGRERRPYLVSFETKHSRKCVGYAYVVVNDEHARRGFGVGRRRRHRRHYAIFSHFGRRICSGNVYGYGGCVSPILVRPVREQLEHDRIIRLLQAKYKRKFDVAINPGNEQTAPVGGPPPWFPDLVLQSERGRKLLGVVEVETAESVNHLEAMSQWAAFSRLRTPFHLYVPVSMIDVARRLVQDMQIPVAEIWAYHVLGDQLRFTLVQKSAQPELKASKPAPLARAAATPARSSGPNGQDRTRARATGPAARKAVAKKSARPAARRAAPRKPTARPSRSPAKKSPAARAQKRK